MIEEVEALDAQLGSDVLRDICVLEEREVPVVDTRPAQDARPVLPRVPSSGRAKANGLNHNGMPFTLPLPLVDPPM